MRPTSLGPSGIIVLILLGMGLLFAGLRLGTTTITYDDSPPVSIPTTGDPVVASLRVSGGFSLLGVRFGSHRHHVEVRFITGSGCSALLTPGDVWPTPHEECTSRIELTGAVAALGVTIDGLSLVGVELTVSRSCYEQLQLGLIWPTGIPDCDPPSTGASPTLAPLVDDDNGRPGVRDAVRDVPAASM